VVAALVLFNWHHTGWTRPKIMAVLLDKIHKAHAICTFMPLAAAFKASSTITNSTNNLLLIGILRLIKNDIAIRCWTKD
jgi:hypothetical protein